MQCAYGMHGAKRWKKLPRNGEIENPVWMDYLAEPPLVVDHCVRPKINDLGLDESQEIALLNSRDYQDQIENMYLRALSLTFQRYRFDVRPIGFGGEPASALFYENQPNDESNLELGTTRFGFSKLLPAGGQVVAELTNNTLWMFSGGNNSNTATSLAYSLVQPLMAGAGRETAMENLTQSERNVLYSVRDFARFRKTFYVSVVTGQRPAPLPGNSLGGDLAFLVGNQNSPSEGYFSILIALQRLRNQERNVRSLESLIGDLELLREAGRASSLDVTQLESSLASARPVELSSRRIFEDRLDRFKVQLGLPPETEVELDDTLLKPFQFVDPRLTGIERQLTDLVLNVGLTEINESVDEMLTLSGMIKAPLADLGGEFDFVEGILPDRMLSTEDADAIRAELDDDRKQVGEIRTVLDEVKASLVETKQLLQAGEELDAEQLSEILDVVRTIRRRFLAATRELTGVTIAVRLEKVTLKPVTFGREEAVRAGLRCRLDLMNRRGFLMDVRRRVEVAADRLEATLNLVVEGNVSTKPLLQNDNPLGFRADESNYRVGVEVTTPLDRRRQRNEFRAAQISYQRARRSFMAAEDQVKLDIRRQHRLAVTQADIFEWNRRALKIAARELDQAIEMGERPDAPAGGQGINISRALDNVLRAQNRLIESWVAYETSRLALYRDIGLMEIDERGLWLESDDLSGCLGSGGSCLLPEGQPEAEWESSPEIVPAPAEAEEIPQPLEMDDHAVEDNAEPIEAVN